MNRSRSKQEDRHQRQPIPKRARDQYGDALDVFENKSRRRINLNIEISKRCSKRNYGYNHTLNLVHKDKSLFPIVMRSKKLRILSTEANEKKKHKEL